MGTMLYIILKVLNKINVEDDWINICYLLAIDSVALAILFHAWLRRPGKTSEKPHDVA